MNSNDILKTIVAINMGISPIENVAHDVNRILGTLSPDDARAARRKFRKIWRTIARSMIPTVGERRVRSHIGLGEASPTKVQKNNRKTRVMLEIDRRVREITQAKP